MSTPPVVSVIIPTYNHSHFLREALRSLCDQTYTAWEAIVVNNYSEDDTIAVIESFADPRIRLENFRNHGVIAASRNHGISLAQGAYIAFLDSDDTWYPEKLAKCMVKFSDDIGLVCHGLHWIGEQERDVFCGPGDCATFDALLDKGSCITPSAAIVSKQWLDSVARFSEDIKFVTAEDYHLWLKLAQAGIQMHFMEEILGQYRVHSGNQSGAVLRHLNAVLCVVDAFLPAGDSGGLQAQIRLRRRYGMAYYGAGRGMQRNMKYVEAWPLLLRAIQYWPFFYRSYIAIALNLVGVVRQSR